VDTADRRDWAGLAVLVLPCLLVSMDTHVLNLAVPMIVADLRPGGAQLLWILDGYVFLVAGSLLAMGALGDRIGRRRLLLIGVNLFAAASLAAGFAPSAGALIAARVAMGLAGASLMPSTLALIRGMFTDRRQRVTALGVWAASFSLGGLLAPVVGGLLLQRFWWGSVFLLAVPVALLLLVLGPVLLPEFRDETATGFDLAGAVLSLCALLTLVYGVKRAAEGGHPIAVAAPVLFGAAIGAVFVRRQRRAARPMVDPEILRGPGVRAAFASTALTFFVLYAIQVAIAQYLQWTVGLTALAAGLWTLPSVVAYLAATALGPAALRRFTPVRTIGAGLLVVALGCVLLALVVTGGTGTPTDLALIVAGGTVFSVGLAPVYIVGTDLIVAAARPEQAGAAGAVTETGAELGGALGIALLGSLGVAVYRHASDDGTRTFGDAVTAARGRDDLLQHARSGYELAFAATSGTAAVLIVVTAAVILWSQGRGRRAKR
jgi:DHA2 family multidrug resistance protein-like MFS transporter